jgi:hypothetical protein
LNDIKHALRYLKRTIILRYIGLFYTKETNPVLIGYADVGYLSGLHKVHFQIGYLFICGGTVINSFADSTRVTKSYIPTTDAPIWIEVLAEQNFFFIVVESKARQKRGRSISSKDKYPRQKRGLNHQDDQIKEVENKDQVANDEKIQASEINEKNTKLSINYTTFGKSWNWMETTVDDVFFVEYST